MVPTTTEILWGVISGDILSTAWERLTSNTGALLGLGFQQIAQITGTPFSQIFNFIGSGATYIGYVVTGSVWGAVVATAAVCLPAMTLMIVLTRFYLALRNNAYIRGVMFGMRPMILAMIALAGAVLFTPVTFIDYKSWLIFGAVFLASLRKIDPILLIVLSGVAGYLIYG